MHKHHSTGYLPAAGKDAFLPFYDALTKVLGAGRLHRQLVSQANLETGQRVLEIGCGTGNLSVTAKKAQSAIELTAIDPDPKALARARKKTRDVRFEQVYAQSLPYADESFDTILSALMLHHLDRATKIGALREARRVLRPGGRLHIVDIVDHGMLIHGDQPHFDKLTELLDEAGFQHSDRGEAKLRLAGHVVFIEAGKA